MQACTLDGTVYDIVNIVNYVQKFHRHPVTGQPLALKDIVTLTFHKNADGEYHCPVLHKVFTESTHIVAVRTTGHVYCYEVRPCICNHFVVRSDVYTGAWSWSHRHGSSACRQCSEPRPM